MRKVKKNNPEDFPKILIIGHFNQKSPVGITIKNIFKKWPIDKIAIASFNNIENISSSICNKYYCLGSSEIQMNRFSSFFQKIHPSKVYHDYYTGNKVPSKNKADKSSNIKIYFNKIKNFSLRKSGFSLIKNKYNLSPQFRKWIVGYNPDIIYFTIEDLSRLYFLIEIKKQLNKDIAVHIMDDWIHTAHKGLFLSGYWKKKLRDGFKDLLNHTKINIAISDKMSEEYKKKYLKSFSVLHNPIDLEEWKQNKIEIPQNKYFKFIYTGKIGSDHVQSIKDFIKIIEDPEFSSKVEFEIYSMTERSKVNNLLNRENTKKYYRGSLRYSKIANKLLTANALLLPLSFLKNSFYYTRLSMPTKVTEYMNSGTPIFCYAPKNTAVSEYLSKNKIACIVNNKADLRDSLREFLENKSKYINMASNAQKIVIEKHGLDENTSRLIGILNKR